MVLHEQLWMLLADYKEVDHIDAEFAYIIFRLLLDPANLTLDESSKMLGDYIHQYKEAVIQFQSGSQKFSSEDPSHNDQELEIQPWPLKELIRQFRKLTEDRLVFLKIHHSKNAKDIQQGVQRLLYYSNIIRISIA
jgi:hypothetical protein